MVTKEQQAEIQSHVTLRLKATKFAACIWCGENHPLTGGEWQNVNTILSEELATQAVRTAVTWYCYGSEARTVRYPADWLEAAKERWAPRWFLARWPVRRTVVSVRAMFPELTVMGYGADVPLDIRKETA